LEGLDGDVERAKLLLGPEVVRAKHTGSEDWDGDPAIFFRIVLADSAIYPGVLSRKIQQLFAVLFKETRSRDRGLIPYLSVRSQTEQATSNDAAWA